MKAKYILSSLLLAGCTFFSSCEDNLDISQHGVSTFENFYKTDADAEEAIIACYSNWRLKADMGSKLFYLAKGLEWTPISL